VAVLLSPSIPANVTTGFLAAAAASSPAGFWPKAKLKPPLTFLSPPPTAEVTVLTGSAAAAGLPNVNGNPPAGFSAAVVSGAAAAGFGDSSTGVLGTVTGVSAGALLTAVTADVTATTTAAG
jgi:hypothetical protein